MSIKELLLKSNLIYEKGRICAVLPGLVYLVEEYKKVLNKALNDLGFLQIHTNKEIKNYNKDLDRIFYFMTCKEGIYKEKLVINFFESEEQYCRKTILDLLETFKNTIKDYFGVLLISGMNLEENEYQLILLNKDYQGTIVCRIGYSIIKNNYYVKGEMDLNNLIDIICFHYDDLGILQPNTSMIQASIIPHKSNMAGINKTCREIEETLNKNGFRTRFINSDDVNKIITESNIKGIPLRIELGPRDLRKNLVRIYFRNSNEYQEIEINKVLNSFPRLLNKYQRNLLNESIEKNYLADNGEGENYKEVFVCKDCLEKMNRNILNDKILFIPFNQNCKKEVCELCNKLGNRRVICINKENQ